MSLTNRRTCCAVVTALLLCFAAAPPAAAQKLAAIARPPAAQSTGSARGFSAGMDMNALGEMTKTGESGGGDYGGTTG